MCFDKNPPTDLILSLDRVYQQKLDLHAGMWFIKSWHFLKYTIRNLTFHDTLMLAAGRIANAAHFLPLDAARNSEHVSPNVTIFHEIVLDI